MTTNFSLSKAALDNWTRSGLTLADAKKSQIADSKRNGFSCPSYLIPGFDLNGKVNGSGRVRYIGDTLPKNKKGKEKKYDQPLGSEVRAYFSPLLKQSWPKIAKDPAIPLLITEGEKKAACACKHGLPTIGLGGVWNFKSKKRGIDLIDDLKQIDWCERDVTIAYDSDATANPDVRQAELHLTVTLEKLGAKVSVVRLPAGKDGAKVGLDDYLVAHGVKAFRALPREDTLTAGALILAYDAPAISARAFISARFTSPEGFQTLYCVNGDFYDWRDTHYGALIDEILRAKVYAFLETGKVITKEGLEQFNPTAHRVNDVLDALRAAAQLHVATGLPSGQSLSAALWLTPQKSRPDAGRLIPCTNGLLDPVTMKLLPHTPELFNQRVLSFAYDSRATRPIRWLKFLKELWLDDAESINTLQEIFGLLLTTDTRYQKIFLIVGPKRGGKGTIITVLRALLGEKNVVAPTLNALTRNFGLEPLIGKTLAVVSDARLGERADQKVMAERLLSISGEDVLTVDRKYRSAWTGKLGVRFLVTTNEIPRIADASGALASRFIVLRLTESFFGREDLSLADKLLTELPAVLNWALIGLKRLTKRGHFIQPTSASQSVELLQDLTSPMSAFLRNRCVIGPQCSVSVEKIFAEWKSWRFTTGYEHSGTEQSFGRDLHAAVPGLRMSKRRAGGGRVNVYEGIGITKKGGP